MPRPKPLNLNSAHGKRGHQHASSNQRQSQQLLTETDFNVKGVSPLNPKDKQTFYLSNFGLKVQDAGG